MYYNSKAVKCKKVPRDPDFASNKEINQLIPMIRVSGFY